MSRMSRVAPLSETTKRAVFKACIEVRWNIIQRGRPLLQKSLPHLEHLMPIKNIGLLDMQRKLRESRSYLHGCFKIILTGGAGLLRGCLGIFITRFYRKNKAYLLRPLSKNTPFIHSIPRQLIIKIYCLRQISPAIRSGRLIIPEAYFPCGTLADFQVLISTDLHIRISLRRKPLFHGHRLIFFDKIWKEMNGHALEHGGGYDALPVFNIWRRKLASIFFHVFYCCFCAFFWRPC